MAKPVGVFDRDDVLLSFIDPFLRWHARTYGSSLRFDEVTAYDFWTPLGITLPEAVRRVQAYYHTPDHADMTPLPEARSAVELLATKYDLVVVTARDEIDRAVTVSGLDRHFGNLITAVHFTNAWSQRPDARKRTKLEVCRALNAQFIVEDAPHTALECHAAGVLTYVVHRPWNTDLVLQGARLPRPASLSAIAGAILGA